MRVVVWHERVLDDRDEIMENRANYASFASAVKHDEEIGIKGEALGGVVTYKSGRVKGTYEYVFSDHFIIVYRVDKDALEILSVVPTAMNWAEVEKKIKSIIK